MITVIGSCLILTNEIAWFVSSAAADKSFSSEGFQNLSVSNTALNCFEAAFDACNELADKPSCDELVAGEKIDTLSAVSAPVKFNARIGPLDKASIADLWKNIPFFSNDLSTPPKTCLNCSTSSTNTGVL